MKSKHNMPHVQLPQSDFQYLEKISFFQNYTSAQIIKLLHLFEIKKHNHHQTVFEEGEPAKYFYLIIDGYYKLSKYFHNFESGLLGENKKEIIISISRKNDFVGILLMTNPQSIYPVTMTSLGQSSVLQIPQQTYLTEWILNPDIVAHTQKFIYNRCQKFHFGLNLNHLSLEKKVIQFLSHFLIESSEALFLPITRKEIANLLGANCESVIRIMSSLEKKGIIKTKKGVIEIIYPPQLFELIQNKCF